MRKPRQSPTWTPTPCCSKVGMKRGPWTAEEDELLASFVQREGEGRWRTLPKRAGLLRCGKSCRLRWMNYLRPSVKHDPIAPDEEDLILRLHRLLGNRWSLIAGRIPGRTDNEIKNYWNTHLSKKLIKQGIDPRTHKPFNDPLLNTPPPPSIANPNNRNTVRDNNTTAPPPPRSPPPPPRSPPPPPPPPPPPQELPCSQFGIGGLHSTTADALSDLFDCFIDGNVFMQQAETNIPVDPSFGLSGLWEDDFHYYP